MDKDLNYPPGNFADVNAIFQKPLLSDCILKADDPYQYDDTLKFSHVLGGVVEDVAIYGGKENAIDLNRECMACEFYGILIYGGRHCGIVVKGGSMGIRFKNVRFMRIESAYEIELGGWSDQSDKPTRNVSLENVTRADGKHVRVVVGNADKPTIIGGNVRVLFWRSLALKAFVFLKGLFR
jgi:hypothetical protein